MIWEWWSGRNWVGHPWLRKLHHLRSRHSSEGAPLVGPAYQVALRHTRSGEVSSGQEPRDWFQKKGWRLKLLLAKRLFYWLSRLLPSFSLCSYHIPAWQLYLVLLAFILSEQEVFKLSNLLDSDQHGRSRTCLGQLWSSTSHLGLLLPMCTKSILDGPTPCNGCFHFHCGMQRPPV